jgi:hypothetical protein
MTMNKILYILLFVISIGAVSCTSTFEDTNTNPYGITDADLATDYYNVGGYFSQLQNYIYNTSTGLQVEQNLVGDAFAQYMVPPTPFQSNVNNVTYKYVWYSQLWSTDYSNVMTVINLLKTKGYNNTYPNFWAWATILKIFSMQQVVDNYGPMIYSNYGSSASTIAYDAPKSVYYSFFAELDTAVSTLANYTSSTSFEKFDKAYGGDVKSWIKAANSLRLRLAMRIVKVDPTKAQTEAEKAVSNSYGLISSNDENLNVDLNGAKHPLWYFSSSWSDCRMCATMGSILGGYSDPRLSVYFDAATDASASGKYIGIRQGIDITSKSTYVNFSAVGSTFTGASSVQIMTAAEVSFLLAEGALRGWSMGNTAAYYYHKGIELSLSQYGLSSSYSTYVNDASSTFADYTDPHNATNNFSKSSSITIKWDDNVTNEKKLERIITQKWIAMFPNGQEAWAEFRRTGYPKLIPVVVNYSGGTISTSDFVRRVPYPTSEYTSNAAGVAGGVTLLGGQDNGGTRVWWDTTGSNF